jgi:hypothetical protein
VADAESLAPAAHGGDALPVAATSDDDRSWPWLLLGGLVCFLVVEAEKLVIRLARHSPREA